MNSLERVLCALSHREGDRVPFFLLLTLHGAKELGLSIKDYFSKAEHVVEGQIRLRKKFHHDCYYAFFYAPVEIEAWGGEVIYRDDGPANSGEPFLKSLEDVKNLEVPSVRTTPCLQKVVQTCNQLKLRVGNEAPIIGVVMSPFSLPVMQMGFESYLEVLLHHPDIFNRLMQVNEEFCVEWANAQLAAGATAICYFDPLSSASMIPRSLYLETGHKIARRLLPRIGGPVAIHLASGRCLPIMEDIIQTGPGVVGVSAEEDLALLKKSSAGKVALLGNLNGLAMCRWTPEQAQKTVKDCIMAAGKGGGYILSDNHGEIPWQVPDSVLGAVSEAVHEWGQYPLKEGV